SCSSTARVPRRGSPFSDGHECWPTGIAGVVYDKRGTAGSTGDFRTTDFGGLAGDAKAVMGFARSHSWTRAAPLGLLGTSQGGWIIPKAARGEAVAFLV